MVMLLIFMELLKHGHFNYKGAGASQMNTPDEGSPVVTGQGGRALGSTTQRAGTGSRSGGSSGTVKSSIVLALKNGVQGKLNTATGKFTPAEFSPAERARYTKFGGTIPEAKPKVEPQNKLLGTLTGAATGAAAGAMFGGPLGALIGGVTGGLLGSGILSGESDPNKPKRSSFPMGRSGGKKYNEAMKKYRVEKQKAAEKKKVSAANKPKRSDFPMGRSGGKAYSNALMKHRIEYSTQPANVSSVAKLGTMNPNVSTPSPPSGGGSNVKVIRMPSSATPDNPNDKNTGGSDVNAASTGNGNKVKWNILGIPMPF